VSLTSDQAAELAQLIAARTALISGGAVAEITKSGRTLKYAAADLDRIDARIAELEALRDGVRRRAALIFRL
jgi:hypothetical protein